MRYQSELEWLGWGPGATVASRSSGQVTKSCAQCGKVFGGFASAMKARKFCSRACSGLARRTSKRGPLKPGSTVERLCKVCGVAFAAKRGQATCSRKCAADAMRATWHAEAVALAKQDDPPSLSEIGERFGVTRERVRQVLLREGVYKKRAPGSGGRKRVPRVTKVCRRCGSEFSDVPCRAKVRRYCSKECGHRVWSDEEALWMLWYTSSIVGRPATEHQVREIGRISHSVYFRKFGSLRDAQAMLGMTPNYADRLNRGTFNGT